MAYSTPVPYLPGASLTGLPAVMDMTQRTQSNQVQGAATTAPTPPPVQAPDPFSRWGGKANYDAMRSGFGAQHTGITDSANSAADTAGRTYGSSILDFIDSLRAGQSKIDNQGNQIELAKRQGMDAITTRVGDGIRSSGSFLSNRNAGSSSAVEALARAYSTLGQRDAQKVGTQYGVAEDNLGIQQNDLNTGIGIQRRHNSEAKLNTADNLVNDAAAKLSALDAQIAGASLPDRIAIEQEKAAIRDRVNAALAGGDATFESGVAGVRPTDKNTRVGKAAQLATSGVTADNPFNFTSEVPGALQGTGNFSSELPLFTIPRQRQVA